MHGWQGPLWGWTVEALVGVCRARARSGIVSKDLHFGEWNAARIAGSLRQPDGGLDGLLPWQTRSR